MRKQKKYHLIYKTTNLLNGKYYIGMHSTDNLDDGYMGSGRRLRYSINKHGKDNHKVEILEFVNTRKELIAREEEIVNLNEIAKIDCMNLKVGGSGGFSSEEHRLKFINSHGGEFHADRMKNDVDYYNRIKEQLNTNRMKSIEKGTYKLDSHRFNWKDKTHSEETKQKMRKSKNVGSNNSQFGKRWITNEIENKKINKDDLIPSGWRLGRIMK